MYRNVEDEAGIDFVEERPGRQAEVVTSVEGHAFTSAMTWAELLAAVALPDERLIWAQRLILMLPMLGPQELSEDAEEIMQRALDGIVRQTVRPWQEPCSTPFTGVLTSRNLRTSGLRPEPDAPQRSAP